MTMTTGQAALVDHLRSMTTTAGIAYPNGATKDLPRYWVQIAGGDTETFDLGGTVEAEPMISVSVETVAGEYATESDAMVSALEARFRPGTRITYGGVTVTIVNPPSPRPPITGDGVYSVPVIIRGWLTY